MTSTKIDALKGPTDIRALQPDATEGALRVENGSIGVPMETGGALAADEMAFTRQGDIEAYANGLTIPPETIEKWISAGLLFPDEIRMAEKIIKILREKLKFPGSVGD